MGTDPGGIRWPGVIAEFMFALTGFTWAMPAAMISAAMSAAAMSAVVAASASAESTVILDERSPREDSSPDEPWPMEGGVYLPATRCGDLFFVEATLDRLEGRYLLVDTGAEVSVLDSRVHGALVGSGRATDATATGSGGVSQGIEAWRRLDKIAMGEFVLTDVEVAVMDLSSIEVALGHRLDGILGYSAFLGYLVELDYPSATIRVGTGALPEPDGLDVLSLASRARPYVSLKSDGKYMQALLDTGATGALSLPNLESMDGQRPPTVLGRSHGVGGSTQQGGVRLRGSLMLGKHELQQPVVLSSKTSGRLGGGLLRHFVVTIDAEQKKVALRRDSDDPIIFGPVRGLSVELDLRGDAWVVTEVYGAAVGGPLRKGDRIVAVNEVLIAAMGCDRFGVFRGKDTQETLRLSVWRRGAKIEVVAPIREMLE